MPWPLLAVGVARVTLAALAGRLPAEVPCVGSEPLPARWAGGSKPGAPPWFWAVAEERPPRMLPQGSRELVSARGRLRRAVPAGLIPEPAQLRARRVRGGFSSQQQALAPGAGRAPGLGTCCPPRGPWRWVSAQACPALAFPPWLRADL